ncbi:unnamed protein product [Pleuronectes platessa]|uniref:Secreted protein n=1 Tax=Pleuronectes platessa TaxID=8262 RepID=A0A9N7UK27_PLEPL|nr:unnamed protein product [Pleuronectes platessa]
MKHCGACAPNLALPCLFVECVYVCACACGSRCALRLHSQASRHVSGLPGPGPSFFFSSSSSSFPPPSLLLPSQIIHGAPAQPHGPDPPVRISAPRCVKTNTSAKMDGWMDARPRRD